MKNLDRSVTEYYQKQQLEPAVLEAILLESEQLRAQNRQSGMLSLRGRYAGQSPGRMKVWVPVMAAAVLMLVLAPMLWNNSVWNDTADNRNRQVSADGNLASKTNGSVAAVNTRSTIADTASFNTASSDITTSNPASTGTPNLDARGPGVDQNPLSNIVMREASLNHKSQLQLDFETNDFQKLSRSMEQLDFELELPARLLPVSGQQALAESSRTMRLQLAGGRYCTVAGNLAAHVKLQNSANADVSLFVTPHNTDFESVSNQSAQYDNGVQVSSWNENGLFYLLVTQP